MDFLEVVSQIAARTERRVAHDANVISDPTEIQNQNSFLFKDRPVLLKMTQVDFPPGFGKGLATLLAFIWHLFFWSVQILSVLDQGALRAKTLTTVDTLEGFLVGVNAFVDVEKRSVSKLFGAVGAWKWVFWHLEQEWSLIEMGELSIYNIVTSWQRL